MKVTAKQSRHRSESDSSSESDAEDDSEYSSSDEEGLEIEEPSPLPATKPTDPVGIVRYDTIKALYLPTPQASSDQIKKGLIDYGAILKPIRESIKAGSDALKSAEDAKNTALIPGIKSRLVDARSKLEAALETAVGTGHQDILEQYVNFLLNLKSIDRSVCLIAPNDRISMAQKGGPREARRHSRPLFSVAKLPLSHSLSCLMMDCGMFWHLKIELSNPPLRESGFDALNVYQVVHGIPLNAGKYSKRVFMHREAYTAFKSQMCLTSC